MFSLPSVFVSNWKPIMRPKNDSSVADPDPYVFRPPGSISPGSGYGSGSESGSGSGSLYHQAKIVRKTLIYTVLWLLYDFLSLKNDVNVTSKSNKQKT